MRYYKIVENGYITAIGTGDGGTKITKTEYDAILITILEKPIESETIKYRLKNDLTWESYEVEPGPEPEPEPDTDEILAILLGGDPE